MQVILNTIVLCKQLAKEKGHNLGQFKILRLTDEVCLMYAVCQNSNCLWYTMFNPFGQIIIDIPDEEHHLVLSPSFVFKNCQELVKPSDNELMKLAMAGKKINDFINEKQPGVKVLWHNEDIQISVEKMLTYKLNDMAKCLAGLSPELRSTNLQLMEEISSIVFEQYEIIEAP